MKKKILIIDGPSSPVFKYNEDTPNQKALGGSETWIVETAKGLSNRGYNVSVICNTDKVGTSNSGVYYMTPNLHFLDYRYDTIIISRKVPAEVDDYLVKNKKMYNNIILQVHDTNFSFRDNFDYNNLKCRYKVTDIVCVSNWHSFIVTQTCDNIPTKYLKIINNGIYPELFDNACYNPYNRDNSIFWSSCSYRGLNQLVDIGNIVKEKFPDFKIYASSYEDINNQYNCDFIEILPKMSKVELYKEMSKHKVWFYPCSFTETQCITAIENALAGCYIISPLTEGLTDAFNSSQSLSSLLCGIQKKEDIDGKIDKETYDNNIKIYAELIIDALNNYNSLHYQGIIRYNQGNITENYCWNKSIDKWEILLNK